VPTNGKGASGGNGAFVVDPDGNKIEAVTHSAE
jgi:hypothetical protein